jgi:hypothetical protein
MWSLPTLRWDTMNRLSNVFLFGMILSAHTSCTHVRVIVWRRDESVNMFLWNFYDQKRKDCALRPLQERCAKHNTNPTNKGLISADRSNKATLLLTIPCSNQVVCKGFILVPGGALSFEISQVSLFHWNGTISRYDSNTRFMLIHLHSRTRHNSLAF